MDAVANQRYHLYSPSILDLMRRRSLLKSLSLYAGAFATRTLPALDTPPSIRLNQLGFLPGSLKIASVAHPGAAHTFDLLDAQNNMVRTGGLTAPMHDAASGDTISLADFSTVTTPGTYRLRIGPVRSEPFRVAPDVYANTLRATVRGYTGQRCGCAVDLGGGYQHPPCHLAAAWHLSSGRTGPLHNRGGWHDAGDYGRYIVNSAITMGTLLWAWELYQPALTALQLDLPGNAGPLPGFLAELRWNLDWMLTLQDADGGVWHKQTSEHFCGFVMPQNDTFISYVIGTGAPPFKSTCATAGLAAVAAIAARVYRAFDAGYADRCLQAARSSWQWAVAHPDATFTNPPGITTGGYDDTHCADQLLWAAAELARATGEPLYRDAFLAGFRALPRPLQITAPSWSDVTSMALWTTVLAARPFDNAAASEIRAQTIAAARFLSEQAARNGYGNTLALGDYVWGSNGVAAAQSMLLLIADRFAPSAMFRGAALANLDYLVGRNCFGVSWITQAGVAPFLHPHHRPSIADGIAAPWPGLLSGGPNARPADPVAQALPPAPPMRMWVDNELAYSVNEVAINWNAPLVFLLAASV